MELAISEFMDEHEMTVMLVSDGNKCRIGVITGYTKERVAMVLLDALQKLDVGIEFKFTGEGGFLPFYPADDDLIH